MDILDEDDKSSQSNTEVRHQQVDTTAVKIEPSECNDSVATFTNLCDDIKIEIVENELPQYEDIDLQEMFQAPKEPSAKASSNSNIEENTKTGCIEVPTNTEKCINVKKITDLEPSLLSTDKNIKKLPKSDNDSYHYCEICKVKYLSKVSLQAHMRLHDQSRKFKCNTCGYRYKNSWSLERHIMNHSEAKFECDTCDFKSKWKNHFNQHMRQKHGEIPADKNTKTNMTDDATPGSSQQYPPTQNIDKNQSQNKDGGNTLYHQCNICDYKSFVKHALDRHMKLHDLKRKYQCDICSCRFSTKQDILRHMSKHSDKKYSCRVCGRQFKFERYVARHMHVHEGVLYRCQKCGHLCNSRQHLSRHSSQKHNNSYKCNVCLKMFTNSSYYTRHMKSHLNS